jgi:crossover junction endodeoxyribonuclease RusA
MTITLPLPSAKLSPNARISRFAKAKLVKLHRERAKIITRSLLPAESRPHFTRYTLTFYFSTNRQRDDDNWSAACKSYRDGIADALGIDDHHISLSQSPLLLVDANHPRLLFTLLP